MNDPTPLPADDDSPELHRAGADLRHASRDLRASDVEVRALRRRARRRGVLATAAVVLAVVAVAGAVVVGGVRGDDRPVADGGGGPEVDRIVSSLAAEPIDPTRVHLVGTVETFPGCDALIDDLRRVGAEHVGSRGFGSGGGMDTADGSAVADNAAAAATADGGVSVAPGGGVGGETLGTNVQVPGVDELDRVKAEDGRIYDLDGRGGLRITDGDSLDVAATVRIVTEDGDEDEEALGGGFEPSETADSLLVADGRVVVFGSRWAPSEPVPGDPSATRSVTHHLVVTFVDATGPGEPRITDRVDIEGTLVSARLVDGDVRLVTTSDMDDLGFVLPTTPASVARALDRNRRSVAGSSVTDWIPDWQRDGGSPEPLVPCERVHVPDTFAGVAMTSMVSFPIGTGEFQPEGTSILAPGDTLYAGPENVAVSSHVWVDPIDRPRVSFDDWQTAIHEFSFSADGPPSYRGSGIVDGSTVGQFAFGEVGDTLGVVTTRGTPWQYDVNNSVDLVLLARGGAGELAAVARVDDLAGGRGMVGAVRFLDDRILVSVGDEPGESVRVVDVSDPTRPRAAGSIDLPGPIGYFHPVGDQRALLVGSRTDRVPFFDDGTVPRSWVRAELFDVTDADHPEVSEAWEGPWMTDSVGSDHHAFTWWEHRGMAMWGVDWSGVSGNPEPNHAVVLGVGDDAVTERALPEASQPPEAAAPCPRIPVDHPALTEEIGSDTIVLGCTDPSTATLEWPRHSCSHVAPELVRRYAPDRSDRDGVFLCRPAPLPRVVRVLVVDGRPVLFTDQTLEALDPETFAPETVVFHPTDVFIGADFID